MKAAPHRYLSTQMGLSVHWVLNEVGVVLLLQTFRTVFAARDFCLLSTARRNLHRWKLSYIFLFLFQVRFSVAQTDLELKMQSSLALNSQQSSCLWHTRVGIGDVSHHDWLWIVHPFFFFLLLFYFCYNFFSYIYIPNNTKRRRKRRREKKKEQEKEGYLLLRI